MATDQEFRSSSDSCHAASAEDLSGIELNVETGSRERLPSEIHVANNSNTDVKLVEEVAKQYAGLICVEHTKEFEQFGEVVEDLLTKLDDFLGYADLIRGDLNMALGGTLDAVHSKTNAMKTNFEKIDKLEVLISVVKKDLALLEANIDQAEIDLGTINPIKKVFNSFTLPSLFAPKSAGASVAQSHAAHSPAKPAYRRVQTFRTSDFFSSSTAAGAHTNIRSDQTKVERTGLEQKAVSNSNVQTVPDQNESVSRQVPQGPEMPCSTPSESVSERNTSIEDKLPAGVEGKDIVSSRLESNSITGVGIREQISPGAEVNDVLPSGLESKQSMSEQMPFEKAELTEDMPKLF